MQMTDHLGQLTVALDRVVEILNRIPDDADYRGKTWEAIQKLREACTWLGVERFNQ